MCAFNFSCFDYALLRLDFCDNVGDEEGIKDCLECLYKLAFSKNHAVVMYDRVMKSKFSNEILKEKALDKFVEMIQEWLDSRGQENDKFDTFTILLEDRKCLHDKESAVIKEWFEYWGPRFTDEQRDELHGLYDSWLSKTETID